MATRGGRRGRREPSGLEVASRREGEVGVLTLTGEARLEVIHVLDEAAEALRGQGARHLVLGLQGLSFMDSASISSFLRLDNDFRSSGGCLILAGVPPVLARLFTATGITRRFSIASDERAAVELASKPRA